jgi:UDP-N-acetylglucosamine--N-acetylmuramyl-(pentapeptide) pyrophosphoryl-undecaprenol N-acetylglucosamine transferase
MEGDMVRRESTLPFYPIDAAAVRGRGPKALFANIFRLFRGVGQAIRLIRRERPAAIFGTGGYVCVPVFVAAWLLGVPRAIYLPDVVPGLAVRFLARISSLVVATIPDAAPYLRMQAVASTSFRAGPRQLVVAGYPVRPALQTASRTAARALFGITDETPVVLVYGGSRGARSLNYAIRDALNVLLPQMHIIHVCGREGDEAALNHAATQLSPDLHERYQIYPYLAADGPLTMTAAFAAADLTVCRSGASVLGELPSAGLPAILVPYPYVHQDENADYLVRHGAASKIADARVGQDLAAALRLLIANPDQRATMRRNMQALAQPQAAHTIAGLLQTIARGA